MGAAAGIAAVHLIFLRSGGPRLSDSDEIRVRLRHQRRMPGGL